MVASYLDDRIPGDEPYGDDEATEYGENPAEKAAGVGVDTGGFYEDLDSMCPVMSVDYGTLPGTLVQVEFLDGSKLHWGEDSLVLREL